MGADRDSNRRAGPGYCSGDDYTASIMVRNADRRARSAFCEYVVEMVPQKGTIFDFGAGTGIDARFYANQGLNVVAYDVDPLMCESFRRSCVEKMAVKGIALVEGSYRRFLESSDFSGAAGFDAITANFAPLSLIDEPHELFGKFHSMLKPGGEVLVSVLNPYFLGDLKYGWWWAHAPAFALRGHYAVSGEKGRIHRRSAHNYCCAAAPFFTLEAVVPGLLAKAFRRRPLRGAMLAASQFMFLRFLRC